MFQRILRSSMMLAALVAAYQAYVLLAVPLMEPSLEMRQRRTTRPPGDPSAQSITRYQLLLSNYFPKDHWSQSRPPKVIASSDEKAMLVIDEYTRHQEDRVDNERFTRVDIKRFALLIFPTPPRVGITPPRDAIVLEAPLGAQLKFSDFRPEHGKIGQITSGEIPGRIRIRSDMHEPGPEDDLLVETADLKMNTKLLYTNSPVRFRMGQNIGGGRELEIRFLTDEHVQPHDTGLKIAGIDSLEIRREVRMRLQLETDSLLPGNDPGEPASHAPRGNPLPGRSGGDVGPSTQSVAEVRSHAEPASADLRPGNENRPKPPMEVTCSGPFTFDFVRYVASLDRDVNLRQINPSGPSDQLFCNQFDLHFAPKLLAGGEAQPVVVDPGKRQQRDLGRLEPAAIVAVGHPVVVVSPARQAQARGERIQIALREQRVRIGGGQDAMLVYGPNILRAPLIDYQHPARGTATTIGRFRASGPGSLQYVPDPAKPLQIFQCVWQTTVDLNREKGQPVLALDGRPQLAFADAGSLTADRIKVYLRELEGNATAAGLPITGGASGGSKLQVAPDRLAAAGRVEIQSAQLTGRTAELLATFRIQPDAPDGATADSTAGGLGGRLNLSAPGGPSAQAFHIDADKMRLEVSLKGKSAEPASLSCEGNILFREVPRVATDKQPLEIRGHLLTVDRLDSGAPYITLRGAGASGSASADGGGAGGASGTQLAQLAGRGITVLADMFEVDGRDNRMWSDGPGKATLLVTRDLEGQTSATPFPLDITWQGGLRFDGRAVVFERNVLVSGADDALRCDRLSARLTAPINFREGMNQQTIDLSEIDCQGQVAIDHLSRDKVGVTSHERMQLGRLTIDQQTGNLRGDGPGIIRSTRFGTGLAALAATQRVAGAPPQPPATSSTGSKLHFLRVDFHGGLTGNLYTRELTFRKHVSTVYGPVDAWEQELDVTRRETLPSEAITLTCNELSIYEDSVAARALAAPSDGSSRPVGPVQLKALGDVQIDGQTPQQGAFTAQANTASYEQAKDVFILEGDGRTPAKLWRAGQKGAPPEARRIRYVRSTGQITVDGIQYFEITPGDLENARRPTTPVR